MRRPQSTRAQPGTQKASAFSAALRDNYRQGGHAWITRPCRGLSRREPQDDLTRRRFAPVRQKGDAMADAVLTINSRNYGSWSLRGFLLCRMAGLDCRIEMSALDDPSARAEL